MNTKKQLRGDIKTLFSEQNREELTDKDTNILQLVLEYIQQSSFKHICIYEDMEDEVSTLKLIQSLRESNIGVYTPQVIGETEMILIDEEYEHYEKEIDLFIIPGRAFTQDWKRLGRGKGYYDRFLASKIYKKSKKLGICYDFQLLDEVITEKHDINMDKIISA